MEPEIEKRQRYPLLIWLFFWAVMGSSVVLDVWREPGQLAQGGYVIWLVCLAAYALASTFICRFVIEQERLTTAILITAFQACCALCMVAVREQGFELGLLTLVAFQLGFLVSLRTGFAWLAIQTGIYAALLWHSASTEALIWRTLGILAYQGLALTSAHFWSNESRARRALLQTNADLRLSRDLLASTSRLAERQRISRELHDLLGHHLTAISLNLEAAHHVADGAAREHVGKARELSRKLLEDVREAVSTIRDHKLVDLKAIVSRLVDGIERPRIHVVFPDHLEVNDAVRAHALLRCAQEIVTNAIRHSSAENLWLEFEQSPDGITLNARDDGLGARTVHPGSGLKGMRERLEEAGGRMKFWSAPKQGFRVEAWIPLPEAHT